ncbi:signal peptidase I [Bacillus sp. USDA818B3_A]|uniref:signal peptidase I n=1 Tax=Bacillus sp. USDA818B3_A TaxID=2698834 RepID=UPI001923F162|nr:signal peptidase I [Bacillus sp. USDA818B3_A]
MKDRTKIEVYSWLKSIAFAFIISVLCRQFIFTPTTVFGESMSPAFQENDGLIVSKMSEIQRFDIIVFDAPDSKGEHYIKRVIGLPGDRMEMKNDVLYINGKALPEPYLIENKKENIFNKLTEDFSLQERTGVSKVPEGMLFVMGDNRLKSKDSRSFGYISYDSVIGEVKFRIYPLQEIGIPQ